MDTVGKLGVSQIQMSLKMPQAKGGDLGKPNAQAARVQS